MWSQTTHPSGGLAALPNCVCVAEKWFLLELELLFICQFAFDVVHNQCLDELPPDWIKQKILLMIISASGPVRSINRLLPSPLSVSCCPLLSIHKHHCHLRSQRFPHLQWRFKWFIFPFGIGLFPVSLLMLWLRSPGYQSLHWEVFWDSSSALQTCSFPLLQAAAVSKCSRQDTWSDPLWSFFFSRIQIEPRNTAVLRFG